MFEEGEDICSPLNDDDLIAFINGRAGWEPVFAILYAFHHPNRIEHFICQVLRIWHGAVHHVSEECFCSFNDKCPLADSDVFYLCYFQLGIAWADALDDLQRSPPPCRFFLFFLGGGGGVFSLVLAPLFPF